jgi:CheY-like chemotaxis protein
MLAPVTACADSELSTQGPRRLMPDAEPGPLAMSHRPGKIVLVDDDADFIDMLALTLPRTWQIETYARPSQCLVALQSEPERWEADLWAQQEIVNLQHLGAPLLPQILRYFAAATDRRMYTSAIVVDYEMPGLTGLELLRELPGLEARRVLLTGANDERLVYTAFNSGQINRFFSKCGPAFRLELTAAIEELTSEPNPRYQQLWRSTLKPDHAAVLRDAQVGGEISAFLRARFVEWVVIGQPLGVVALDAAGRPFWLQLEMQARLDELADMASCANVRSDDLISIRNGTVLCDIELRRELGQRGCALLPACTVGPRGALLAALHPLEDIAPVGLRTFSARRAINQSVF